MVDSRQGQINELAEHQKAHNNACPVVAIDARRQESGEQRPYD